MPHRYTLAARALAAVAFTLALLSPGAASPARSAPISAGKPASALAAAHGNTGAATSPAGAGDHASAAAPLARPVATTPPEATPPSPPPATPLEWAESISAPAMVLLEMHWRGWLRDRSTGDLIDDDPIDLVTRCTGFAVSNDGHLVTAGHCVDAGPDGIVPLLVDELVRRRVAAGTLAPEAAPEAVALLRPFAELVGLTPSLSAGPRIYVQRSPATAGATIGEVTEARVLALFPAGSGDLALLKMEWGNQPLLPLGNPDDVKERTPVLVLGYPTEAVVAGSALELVARPGIVSPVPEASMPPSDQVPAEGKFAPTLALTGGDIASGLDGAAVVNLDGEVLGLVSLPLAPPETETETPTSPPASGSAYTPTSAPSTAAGVPLVDPRGLDEALDEYEVDNRLGKIDQDYRDGLDAYYDGRYDDCIGRLDDVLAALPDHAWALSFRQHAVALREAQRASEPARPEQPGAPTYLGWVGVAAVVLLTGYGLTRWSRPRPASRPPSGSPPPPGGPPPPG